MPERTEKDSKWPAMPSEAQPEKCQSIFWNLICSLEARENMGTVTIYELRHTVRCDGFHDLSHVRNSIEDEITRASLERVLACQETLEDEKRAERCIFHYGRWAKDEIYCGLSPWNKVYYHTLFHWDKWAAGTTLFGATAGATLKLARAIAERRRRSGPK